MNSVERKMKGFYTHVANGCLHRNFPNFGNDQFGTETVPVRESDFGYVLGKESATRKKLAAGNYYKQLLQTTITNNCYKQLLQTTNNYYK